MNAGIDTPTCFSYFSFHSAQPFHNHNPCAAKKKWRIQITRVLLGGDSRTLPESAFYAAREGTSSTVWRHRTLAGSFREFQPPCRARRARDCAPYRARFLASSNDNFGQTVFVIRFSPMTDAVGRIRRCQRSTCVTAALPAPMRGKKIDMRGNLPLKQLG